MTGEEMRTAIQFLLDHHAKVSADIDRLAESLAESQAVQSRQLAELSATVDSLSINVVSLSESVAATQSHLDSVIDEMREGFNNLIVANEVTRKLSEDVARLQVQTAQRVTGLEHRVDDLEAKE